MPTVTIDRYLDYLKFELNRSPLTVEAYSRDLNQFIDWLTCFNPDRFNPADVTVNDIRAWLSGLSKSAVTPRSLRRKVQSLRAFFRYLLKNKIIEKNPASDVTLPKLPKHLPDVVREDELEKILAESHEELADDPADETAMRNLLVVEILYTLGIRRAELIAISDNDINFSSGEIKITGKRAKQRIVPVPQELLDRIAEWQNLRDSLWKNLSEPRPLITVKGKRITPQQVYNIVKRELSVSSAKKRSPHALRHSFATAMLNGGADINSVKEFLGHASLSTTQIYTHISFNEMKKAYSSAHPRAVKDDKKEKNY